MGATKLRVAFIGAGQIAEKVHLPVLSQMKDKVELVSIADTALEKAERLAGKFSIETTFQDYNEMLSRVGPDAVWVCTTNKFHASASLAALRSKCHVFCEKPPAMNEVEARQILTAAEEEGRILSFNFNYRFRGETLAIKKFIEGGELGEIYVCTAQAIRRRGIPGWGSFTNRDLQGGGPVADIGVHMIDLALHLMDFPEPKSIVASTYRKIGNRKGIGLMGKWDPHGFTVEDSAFGLVKFRNGATMIIETAYALNTKERSVMNLHLHGDRAGASLFPPEVYTEMHGELIDINLPFIETGDGHKRSIEAFVENCFGNVSPIPTAAEACVVQKILDGFYESADLDKTIEL
ncbi:MAG TPA: Gfo/Idh/MocA family oxidoreductase [Mesotoga infera]|jgi:predicted dehydrogenase|nr:Gfo/Idh/MocA family oxidoreductase [Mesotoga sp.]NLI06620.1 Gfo/Idh/MocA family oxidoreductase [Thermotogaceae bacterium]HNR80290.1 Gfo/Idh/MocA family oxidoreductase [Mesotoga infera]HNS65966.1 Gfo/Idh/MocA family oxidoreductase [Mesotoga infera]HOI33624.1 Gfo/Idh/MocA family oxidoreductase [Mesotoga infera]